MKVKPLDNYFKKPIKMREYRNIVEALQLSNFMRKSIGISIFILNRTSNNTIVRTFSFHGFICFGLWYSLYIYCTYTAFVQDQTILRILYNTKVQRYGDDYERLSSMLFVIFGLWKIPFGLNINNRFMEIVVEVDRSLEDVGENVDYRKDAHLALIMSILQCLVFFLRLASIWVGLSYLEVPIPMERLYQVIYSDSLAVIVAAHYFFFLRVIRGRFGYINKVLDDIKSHKSWEYKLFARGNMMVNPRKAEGLQEKYICEKIRACAKMYGKLYRVAEATNRLFGSMCMITLFLCLTYIVVYMFYFMEATAAGLFRDVDRYVVFVIYVAWQIFYSVGVTVLIVFVSELAMYEALQFSVQCLHQKPVFTANGLYALDYSLLHQVSEFPRPDNNERCFFQLARTVSTYLVILLQFVTDRK
ncbi:hypothetical protein HF086_012655 [Spodoptera exigua]|uniref:Gustatory receptor n=1 Tax=Spodoptera exigua TaxID=7107 RepID=A0A922MRJ2_SPOEX|nr:hypothetical protein HF086_012655 [Spodoptera exigua]